MKKKLIKKAKKAKLMDPQPIQPAPTEPLTQPTGAQLNEGVAPLFPAEMGKLLKPDPAWDFVGSLESLPSPSIYSTIPPWGKKKKKAEPAAPLSEAQKLLNERKSVFGQSYYGSTELDWTNYDGAGWVHASEIYSFQRNYAECVITRKWTDRGRMGCAMNEKLVTIEAAEAAGWVMCSYSGNMLPKEETFEAYNRLGEKIIVGNYWKPEYTPCSETGLLVQTCELVTIHKSKKAKRVIPSCLKTHFSQCQKCERWFEKKDVEAREELAGLKLCSDCYVKNLHHGQILAHNDKSYPSFLATVSERLASEIILGELYSTGKKEEVKSHRYFGLEAEVELHKDSLVKLKLNRFHIAIEAKKALGKDFVFTKEDGTLLMNGHYSNNAKDPSKNLPGGETYAGFEIVSAPAAIEFHRERWPKIESMPHYKVLRSWDTETCGLHVHVSRSSLNQLQIGRMLRLVNHPSNTKFIQKIAGRGSDRWWRYIERKVVDIRHPERVCSPEETNKHDRARRVALNISNQNTVEFRIFRGTVNPRHIMRNIEFCDAVCDFCWPATRSISEMDNYANFIAYVGQNRKRWPMLAAWFVYQKHLTLKKIGEGADPTKFTIKPEMVEEPEPKIIQQENSAVVQETVAS